MKRAYLEDISFAGTMRQTVRYLGGWLNNDGRNGVEVRKRKEAAHAGWMAMRGLWSNNQVERSVKMVVFWSLVRSSLLSGQEAVCLLKCEMETMEKTQNWYLCRLMRRGMWHNDTERWTSMPMAEVRRTLKVATIAKSEMASADWTTPRRSFEHVGGIDGQLRMGYDTTIDEQWVPTSETNPWLAQFLEDLIAVCQDSNSVRKRYLQRVVWYFFFPGVLEI